MVETNDDPRPLYLDPERSIDTRIRDLLGRMTLGEKLGQIRFMGGGKLGMEEDKAHAPDELPEKLHTALREGLGNFFYRLRCRDTARVTAANCNAMQAVIREHSRLKIPLLIATEALQGVMIDDATATPIPLALASSWNPGLVRELYGMIARETRSRGLQMAYAPVLDVVGDPRWGRTQETYGEDPFLASELAEACVGGLQGDSAFVDDEHVGACAKHFCGYGDGLGGRNFAPCPVSERELLHRHYPPFRKVVEKNDILGIMAGHHDVDGVPCHANRHLLTAVLRDQWGFRGTVISDANDIFRLTLLHRIVETPEEAAALAIHAGVDLDIINNVSYDHLPQLLEDGRVTTDLIDRTVTRILYVKFRLGLFERPFADPGRAAELASHESHQALSRRAAAESVVLLKNENERLPLEPKQGLRLALVGPLAKGMPLGSYEPPFVEQVSVFDALKARCEATGMELAHAEGCRILKADRGEFDTEEAWLASKQAPVAVSDEANAVAIREAEAVAGEADVIVMCVGDAGATCREAAFFGDHRGDRASLDLPGSQPRLLEACLRTGKPVVVLAFGGRPFSLGPLLEKIDALCCCWLLGQQGGHAAVDILFGDVNPSGKLPVTFPNDVGQLPLRYNLPATATFRQYVFSDLEPVFPFGFGLSYTTFEVSPPELEETEIPIDGRTTVSATVTNTGDRAGAEVVQLYIHDCVASATRALIELQGFQKVWLEPGDSERVRFEVGPEELGFWNAALDRVVEPGTFQLFVGTASDRKLPERACAELRVVVENPE